MVDDESEIELAGEVDFAIDNEGIEYLRVPLSNGGVLQLYGNGIGLEGYDGFVAYGDLVAVLARGGALLIQDEEPSVEA